MAVTLPWKFSNSKKKISNLPIRLPGVTRLIASNDKGMNQALLLTRNVQLESFLGQLTEIVE